MIIDFACEEAPAFFDCDICIIGSGAAALSFLSSFYSTKYKVLVLEAGGEAITKRNQDVYDVITPLHSFQSARDGRFRVFGGTTTLWSGQTLPLDKIDFYKRDWVPFSGWPITYEDLAAYYRLADEFFRVDATDYGADLYSLINKKPLPETQDLKLRFSKWCTAPNLRELYRKKISASGNITLLQNANLCSINLGANGGYVECLNFKTFDGKVGQVKAKKYILACGGIENARLLLASNKQNEKGVGNDHDMVGRFLQDHPSAFIGNLKTDPKRIQSYFNYSFYRKTRILPRLILSDDCQRRHRILNASATIQFITDEDSPFTLAKEIYRKSVRDGLSKNEIKLFARLLRQWPQLVIVGRNYLFNKKVYTPNSMAKLHLMMETPPLKDNRVSLSSQKDELGMPKSVVTWSLNGMVSDTLIHASNIFKTYLEKVNLGNLETESWLKDPQWDEKLVDCKHHIGTTRMSDNEKGGVTDKNCKVFATSNLYLAGSSVFPTSGHANPTLTIVALALRLADHIKDTLN